MYVHVNRRRFIYFVAYRIDNFYNVHAYPRTISESSDFRC